MDFEKWINELQCEIDKLKRKIATIGGGTEVTITPTLESGTKVADFEIDGVEGTIYAPEDTAGIYSTTETQIGTWIDGRPLYRKVVISENVTLSSSEQTFEEDIITSDDNIVTYNSLLKATSTVDSYAENGSYGANYPVNIYVTDNDLAGVAKWGIVVSGTITTTLIYYKTSEAPTRTTKKKK